MTAAPGAEVSCAADEILISAFCPADRKLTISPPNAATPTWRATCSPGASESSELIAVCAKN